MKHTRLTFMQYFVAMLKGSPESNPKLVAQLAEDYAIFAFEIQPEGSHVVKITDDGKEINVPLPHIIEFDVTHASDNEFSIAFQFAEIERDNITAFKTYLKTRGIQYDDSMNASKDPNIFRMNFTSEKSFNTASTLLAELRLAPHGLTVKALQYRHEQERKRSREARLKTREAATATAKPQAVSAPQAIPHFQPPPQAGVNAHQSRNPKPAATPLTHSNTQATLSSLDYKTPRADLKTDKPKAAVVDAKATAHPTITKEEMERIWNERKPTSPQNGEFEKVAAELWVDRKVERFSKKTTPGELLAKSKRKIVMVKNAGESALLAQDQSSLMAAITNKLIFSKL